MIVPHGSLDVGFPNLVVIKLVVHVELEVLQLSLDGGLLGLPQREQASVAWAIDTSMITGHNQGSISGMPERTAKSHTRLGASAMTVSGAVEVPGRLRRRRCGTRRPSSRQRRWIFL
jgi:hypothetical protein